MKKTLKAFLDELGSAAPSPGGGAAAALTAATGTALLEMVSRINDARFRKKEPKADHSQARRRIAEFKKTRLRFLKLISLDTAAFKAISASYKKGKQHPSYQAALKKGYSAPMEICELAVKSMEVGLSETNRTSKWLYSDLVEAGILLNASFGSARLNVQINLNDLNDRERARRIEGRLKMLTEKSAKLKSQLKGETSS